MDEFTIDVSREVEELERVLLSAPDPLRRQEAIAILRRWQFDTMLDEASRRKAAMLVREFSHHELTHCPR